MKKPVLVGIVFIAAVLAVIIYSSMNLARQHVEVCMTYQGRSACGKAAGTTKDFALRAATSNACAQIASGVTDSTACERSDPVSVTWK
ncbi:MAG TPA: hypothetical protein VMB85_19880 [Bryobacteraceae bacterium]|jgi:hypothetical protein|nr:hypothetical protein [Bryobacteraceae bacterium]